MPIIKSAKKRVRVARRATVRNAKTKRALKTAVKSFQKSLASDKKQAAEAFSKAQSALGKAGKKNVLHKNKIARKQRQLAKAAKEANVNLNAAAKKATAKATAKTTAKKTTAKKPAAKQPAAKKSPAKKPAAKK